MVFRTAYRITGNAADAEDVLQTVFVRMLRRQTDADALENEASYLRRAAVNAALDVMRARQAQRAEELQEVEASSRGDFHELRQALDRALAQLKPQWAEIFALRFLEGLTNAEIAKQLKISQVLVAVTIHRARRQLRNELAAYQSSRRGDKL
jgi:RNA polymerase sigma-70 factor, ECF subfamily